MVGPEFSPGSERCLVGAGMRLGVRTSAVLAATFLFIITCSPIAMANFGPHGGFGGSGSDTDACAGCHRSHTSTSEGLLFGVNTVNNQCLTCHGSGAPGAATNVEDGIFDSGPTNGMGSPPSAEGYAYTTDSEYGGALNGGSFRGSTSTHQIGGVNMPMWGSYGGDDRPAKWPMLRCTDCHDPHGTSNYRMLKDVVNGVMVGGYDGDDARPAVVSNELGYPVGGFDRGPEGKSQVESYFPCYTTPKYANGGPTMSISRWCSACHTTYSRQADTTRGVDNGVWEADPYGGPVGAPGYTAVGDQPRHRHPVDTRVADGAVALPKQPRVDPGLPLEMPVGTLEPGTGTVWSDQGFMGCLTCHFAHASSATMSGWANAALKTMPDGELIPIPLSAGATMAGVPGTEGPWPSAPGDSVQVRQGVNPAFSSALLRYANRGVCERCHDQ